MEFLEVFRRWMWIFFRVEAEWVRNRPSKLKTSSLLKVPKVRSNRGPLPDDILLGEMNGGLLTPESEFSNSHSPGFPK